MSINIIPTTKKMSILWMPLSSLWCCKDLRFVDGIFHYWDKDLDCIRLKHICNFSLSFHRNMNRLLSLVYQKKKAKDSWLPEFQKINVK